MRLAPLLAALLAPAALAGPPATDFTLPGGDGLPVALSSHRGQVILVDFWATWCGPCKDELPHVQRMHEELAGRGLVVLAVTTDDARTKGQVKPFWKKAGYTIPLLYDTESTALAAYNPARTLPFSVLIDREFTVHSVHNGYSPGDEVALRAEIEALLAAPPSD